MICREDPWANYLSYLTDLSAISVGTIDPLICIVKDLFPNYHRCVIYGDNNVWFKGKLEYQMNNLFPVLTPGMAEVVVNNSLSTLLREGRFGQVWKLLYRNPCHAIWTQRVLRIRTQLSGGLERVSDCREQQVIAQTCQLADLVCGLVNWIILNPTELEAPGVVTAIITRHVIPYYQFVRPEVIGGTAVLADIELLRWDGIPFPIRQRVQQMVAHIVGQ